MKIGSRETILKAVISSYYFQKWGIKTIKVFVVEDDTHLQFFYKQIITLNGFELVGIANNGEEAISMFNSFVEKPEVILMDHRMPIKNGIDTSKELLKINVNIKIIFLSADNSIKKEALSLGVFSFLDKPFTIEKLIDQIKKAVE